MKKLLPIAVCAALVGCGEVRVVDLNDESAKIVNSETFL